MQQKKSSVNWDMDVSQNSGTPKSSILIGFSIINHPFWGTTIFGNTHIALQEYNISLALIAGHDGSNDALAEKMLLLSGAAISGRFCGEWA